MKDEKYDHIMNIIKEIAEQQKLTDAHLKIVSEQQKLTDEQLKIVSEQQKLTDEQQKHTYDQLKIVSEQQKLTYDQLKIVSEQQKLTDVQIATLVTSQKETKKEIGGIGKSNGYMAEEWFISSIDAPIKIGDFEYDIADHNQKRTIKAKDGTEKVLSGEYDIILTNTNTVLVIQVKYKVQLQDIEDILEKQLPVFRKLFPLYEKFDLYGGIAGLSFDKGTKEMATNHGLFVIGQGKKNISILNKNVRPFVV